MEEPNMQHERPGLNRRDVLRRGAILGGAMVWTVPAVQTLSGPAFAAGSPCVGRFSYTDSAGTSFYVEYEPSDACCNCITTTSASLGGPQFAVVAGALCQVVAGQCTVAKAG